MSPNTHKLHTVTCPNPRAANVLSILLESEGYPSVWTHDAVTGESKVATMAPGCAVRSCIESVSSFAALVGG